MSFRLTVCEPGKESQNKSIQFNFICVESVTINMVSRVSFTLSLTPKQAALKRKKKKKIF